MIPIGDENRGQSLRPWVNYGLIAINFLIFFYELTLSEQELTRFLLRWGLVPAEISHGHNFYTMVTDLFLHGGWLHIFGNMLFLWIFGDNVEDTMGHVRYLLFYLLCGFAGNLGQVLVNPDSAMPLVGASGAIAGILGAYLVMFPFGKIRTFFLIGWIPIIFLVPAWVQIGLWILLQFLNGLATLGARTADTSGGVAFFAHIGGFAAGVLLNRIFRDREAYERQKLAREGNRAFQRADWGG
ncbi:MAG: rhomboid family intramembrane serine protease [Thermomicrobiales bacterium]